MSEGTGMKDARIDPLYDIVTVAPLFGVHKNKVYELIGNGSLEAFRLGRRTQRIPETSIRRYLSEHKIDPALEDVLPE